MGLLSGGLVETLAEFLAGHHERLGGIADGVKLLALQSRLESGQFLLHLGLLIVGEVVSLVGQQLLRLVDEVVTGVADLGRLPAGLVFLGVGLGVTDHLVDDVFVQRRLAGDRHRLLVVGGPVLG